MNADDIKQAVTDGIKEGMAQHAQADEGAKRTVFYIDPEQHFWDHGYIKGQRKAVKTVRTGILYTFGASIFAFIIWVLQSIFIINPPTP